MSEREIPLLLLDIKIAIENIIAFTVGYTFETYDADLKTRQAVERNFEIIGEAASRLPQHQFTFAEINSPLPNTESNSAP